MKNIKNFVLNKKVVAILLLLITIVSNISPVFAVSGSGQFVGGQFASGMMTTDHTEQSTGVLIRKLINRTTGEQYTVFCSEHKVDFKTDVIYNGSYYTPTNATIKRACKIAYFGWYSKYGDYVVNGGIMAEGMKQRKEDYVFTQQYIWETLGQSNATFRDSTNQSKYVNFKNTINSQIDNMQKRPSFDATTVQIEAGETKVLTDTNGVLASYSSIDNTKDNVRFQHNRGENTLTITVSEDCTVENLNISDNTFQSWGLVKEESKDNDTTIYFQFASGVQDQLYAMHYNDPVPMAMSLKINLFGKIELTKLSNNNDLINGAVFNITGPNNYNQDVTVTNGKITIDKLKRGTYTIREKSAPEGYLLNTESYNVEVKAAQTSTQVIKNDEPTGKIILYKVSENNDKIGGAVFKVTAAENITNKAGSKTFYTKGQEVGRITTEVGTGIAQIDNLPLGKYNVKEIQAPNGYLLNEKTYTANLVYKDQNTPVVELKIEGVVNEEPTGTISIIKKDSKTGSIAQGDATLKNAVYKVYANEDIYNVAKSKKWYSKGDLVATRNTDEKGVCQDVTELPLGKYIVKEETAPVGYLIDKKEYEVNLKYKDQYTKIITGNANSTDKVKEMRIHIYKSGIKVDSGKVPGLAGAVFTIKLNSAVQKAYDKGYTYAEVWGGIDENGNTVTVDSKRVAEAQVIAPTYEEIETDENGDAYTKNSLPYGKFIVKETRTPKDYESAADFTFSITDDESEIQDIAKKVKDLIVNNEQQETYIKLIKKDKKSGKIVSLNNATFQIKATKDIYDRATGKILYKKGEVITQKIGSTTYNSFTTNAENVVVPNKSYADKENENGTVVTPLKLEVGSYEITEIKIPEGFLQLDAPVQFKVEGVRDYDKDQDGDFIKEVVVKNEQPTGTLVIDKSIALREDADTSLVDTSDLSGIQFKLTAKEDIIDWSDGSTIYKKGQEVKTYNLDKAGDLTVEKLPMGKYQLQEVKTLDGLVLNDTIYDVEFIKKDDTTKVYTETRDIVNDTTFVEISKTDITGETELEGAKLTILDKDGNVIDSWTSTDKTHKIEGLVVGESYILREEIAPDGFVRATDVKFKIENTKEIQKTTMVDKVVEMTKKNITGDEIEGAKMQVLDKEGKIVDEWVSGKEAHKISNLVEGEKYILHEEIAPEGYVVATDIEFEVTLDKATQHEEMIDKIVEMSKVDVGGNEVEGAKIQVFDKDNNLVDEWVSGKEPHIIKNLKENETYRLHEEITPEGYVKATDVEFKVTTDKATQHEIMIDKIVEMSKVDVGGNEVEGAKIQVFDKDNNLVDEWVSGKEPHIIKNLEENETYRLHEEITPEGYVKATDVEFKVTTDKATQHEKMIDKIVDVTKTDLINGKELEGAELIVTDEEGSIIDKWISEKEPHHITGLEEGKKYILTETSAPYGYEVAESIEFEVSFEKENQLVEMKDMPILKSVRVEKLDKDTKEHIKSNKFVFGIYEDENCTKLIKEAGANEFEGTALFDELRYGTYYIKEIKAPLGYKLSDQIVKIEINDKGVFADTVSLEEKDGVYSFEYFNSLLPKIQTGNETNYILLGSLAVISLIGIIGGIIVLRKKHNEK